MEINRNFGKISATQIDTHCTDISSSTLRAYREVEGRARRGRSACRSSVGVVDGEVERAWLNNAGHGRWRGGVGDGSAALAWWAARSAASVKRLGIEKLYVRVGGTASRCDD
jgi:hypothetical protein